MLLPVCPNELGEGREQALDADPRHLDELPADEGLATPEVTAALRTTILSQPPNFQPIIPPSSPGVFGGMEEPSWGIYRLLRWSSRGIGTGAVFTNLIGILSKTEKPLGRLFVEVFARETRREELGEHLNKKVRAK